MPPRKKRRAAHPAHATALTGPEFRTIIADLGLLLKDAAPLIGLSVPQIHRYAREGCPPQTATLLALLQELPEARRRKFLADHLHNSN